MNRFSNKFSTDANGFNAMIQTLPVMVVPFNKNVG